MTGPRVVLFVTSHRVAAGLLSRDAWQLLEDGQVLAGSDHHPLVAALREQQIGVTVVDEPPARAAGRLLEVTKQTPHRPAVWLVADDGDAAVSQAVAELVVHGGGTEQPQIEVVHGSFDVPGARLLDVVAVMDRLRSPGGCPWDAAQTHRSLAPYLLEETYETLDAIEHDDEDALREELGDLLLQVAFHARVAEERLDRPWSVDDVAAGVVTKLVRRHPHVFDVVEGAAAQPSSVEDVQRHWDELKAAEKGRTSALDGVPAALPALALARKYLDRAASARLVIDVEEPDLPDDLDEAQLGAVLFGIVSSARRRGLDAESALRGAARQFADEVRLAEQNVSRTGSSGG